MDKLEGVSKPQDRSLVGTICADSGIGKTVLAASMPNPIFIRAEDGLQSVKADKRPDAFPIIEKVDMLWPQLKQLIQKDHGYKTLVIDSVTALDRMFCQHVVDSDTKKPKSINQALGGYGAGLAAVASMHSRVRKACSILNEKKGMHIIFIAHADTETIDLPDEDSFTRYSLRLNKKSMPYYVDDVDLVGFMKLETHMMGDEGERKKAISDGTRVLITYSTAANVSKNRFGITEDLEVPEGANPLVDYVPSLMPPAPKAKAK
jgi:hypothetical protein